MWVVVFFFWNWWHDHDLIRKTVSPRHYPVHMFLVHAFWCPCFWSLPVRIAPDFLIPLSPPQKWNDRHCRGNDELSSGLMLVLFLCLKPFHSTAFFPFPASVFCLPLFFWAHVPLSFLLAFTIKKKKQESWAPYCDYMFCWFFLMFIFPSCLPSIHSFIHWNIYSWEKCLQTFLLTAPQVVRLFPQRQVSRNFKKGSWLYIREPIS